jgi:putative membrane protein
MRFLSRLVVAWAVNILALWVAAKLFEHVTSSGWRALIIAGLVFGIVNALVRPVLILLSLPLVLVTLGFFIFFINMAMLALTDWLVGGFDIEGFWTYVGATIVVWLVNTVVDSLAERSL